MRLLLITPGFPDDDRRYTPGVVDTLVALAARGHDLDIHTLRAPPARSTTFRGLSITAHVDGPRPLRFARFLGAIAGGTYDAVWCLWPNHTGLAALAAARRLRRPLIASLAGGELERRTELRYGDPRVRRIEYVLKRAAVVTAGAAPLAARARALGIRVEVAPIGVDFEAVALRTSPRASPPRVVVVSDPSPVKRTTMALDAALAISGDVTHFGRARAPHPGVVHRGFVAPGELRRALANFDLLISASAHESQGVVLIEAAYAGLAIAAFDVGVMKELAHMGVPAAIATRTSAAALSAAGRLALAGAVDGARPPREAIAERFSAAGTAARFEEILGRGRGSGRFRGPG